MHHGIDTSELDGPATAAAKPNREAGPETAAQAAMRKNRELQQRLLQDDELEPISLSRTSLPSQASRAVTPAVSSSLPALS